MKMKSSDCILLSMRLCCNSKNVWGPLGEDYSVTVQLCCSVIIKAEQLMPAKNCVVPTAA